jgi:hypothetical protein
VTSHGSSVTLFNVPFTAKFERGEAGLYDEAALHSANRISIEMGL